MLYLTNKLNKKNYGLLFFLVFFIVFSFCYANSSFAMINELREDTHIINQNLLLGNGSSLITISPNGEALEVDSTLVLEDQIEIRGGNPAASLVLTSDANGLASWTSSGSSEWVDAGNILHPEESSVDELAIGGTSEAGADIFLGVDGTAVFNEQANNSSFRVESNVQENAFIVEGNTSNVGIDIASPSEKLEVNGNSIFAGNIEPSINNGFDLGSDSLRWRDLFLGPESLHIGLSADEAVISYSTDDNLLNFELDNDSSADISMSDSGAIVAESVSAPIITATTTFNPARFRAINNGSAATPSFSFLSDTDTGFYLSGTDIVNFVAGGTDELQIQSSGINILNDFDANNSLTFGNANQATIANTGRLRATGGNISAPGLSFQNDQDSGFFRTFNNNIQLAINGTELVRFQTSGVTISGDLDVNGTTTFDGIFIPNLGIDVAVNGTELEPAYSFENDTDTGIRLAGDDDIRLVAGGADELQITNSVIRVINDFDSNLTSTFGTANQASIISTGQMRAGVGSAAIPSWSFQNDTDTGFYRGGSNDIRFSVGGTQELRVTTLGVTVSDSLTVENNLDVTGIFLLNNTFPVGINGTEMEPAYSFENDTDTGIRLAGDDDIRLVVNGSDMVQITPTTVSIFGDLDSNLTSTFGSSTQASISNIGNMRGTVGTVALPGLSFQNEPDSGFFRGGSNDIRLSVNGSQLMRFITSSTTINEELSVEANSTVEDLIARFDDTHSLGTTSIRWSEVFVGADDLHIGTSTFDEGVIFYNTSNNALRFNLVTAGNVVINDDSENVDFIVNSLNGANLIYADASTDNLGIGFETPSEKLSVNGDGLFAGNILPTVDNGFSLGSDTFRWDKLFLDPGSLSIGTSGDDVTISYNTNADVMEVNRVIEAPTIAAENGAIGPSGSFANAFVLCKGGITSSTSTNFTCSDPRLSDVSSFSDEFFSTSTDTRRVICWGLGAMTDNTSASITIVNNDDNQASFTAGSWNLASGTGADKIASITCSI